MKKKAGYKSNNPLNYYHSNFVMDVGENMSLEQFTSEYLTGLNFELSQTQNQKNGTLMKDMPKDECQIV